MSRKFAFRWKLFKIRMQHLPTEAVLLWRLIGVFLHWLRVFFPLKIAKWFGRDHWYATRVLGWRAEIDYGPSDPHFRTQDGMIIRPYDY